MPAAPDEARDRVAAPPAPTTGLHAESAGRGWPLVLAHGFTQTGRCWGALAGDLAVDHRLVLVDLPGHGGSAGVEEDLAGGADLLVRAGGRACYVGYSMGARFCLHAAVAHPESVDALVLVSGTAGIEDAGERRARRDADDRMADELAPASGAAPTTGLDAFLRRWLAQPMFAGLDEEAAQLGERARNSATGLASSLRLAGTGTQQPLWDRLDELEMPVLLVTGARDEKFDRLAHRMARAIGPNASNAVVEGAGHAPHLERPAVVADLIRSFVSSRPD
jgi:2-succinyl-6-hydroxy-2,4-cyclohexadiene-1-carboxylate synthase